ncbi:Predicted amidohydrolase [Bacillus sp. OV322]|uniref:nitrilase-related carbon-nitrogen hydrolase n=1 Tax=Bacillus sp. OV322 TaxID=1882764 RepID=UPI0008E8B6B9|nr:nitrilase-related carbon-nitrogen hydrolase [Bacillus sp. OV322]SFD00054.1 Predicted amidohydrolase [Bacillus sp. OV322]
MNHRKIIIVLILILTLVGISSFQWSQKVSPSLAKEKNKEKYNQPFKVASIEFNPILNERDKNISELLKVTEKAFKKDAKLVVAPEMATTGYYYADREAIKPFVDTIPGKTTAAFGKLAKKYNAYVVFGMPEVEKKSNLYYNSAVLVGPEGYIGKYRKTQMWETEMHWGAWGDAGVPVFDTKIGKIGINICMDSAYSETARLAGIQGAEILAFPTNSSAQAISALPARAQQNGMFIVSANRSNTENGFHMIGGSAIWSPEGKKLAEAPVVMNPSEDVNEPTITYATIDPKQFDNENKKVLKNRRPELYKEIMHTVAPWDYTKNTTPHDIVAAALQYEPVMGGKEENKVKIEGLIKQAKIKNPKLDLVVLPELSLTGPVNGMSKKNIELLGEESTGVTARFFADIAQRYHVSIVYGYIEKQNKELFNSALLISEDGKTEGKYQKTHLSNSDKKWANSGSSLPVFKTKSLGKIGILLGEDAEYPETASVMAVKRADIITIPSSWKGQYGGEMEINKRISANTYPEGSMVTWDAVAIGAQAYTIVANYVGTDQDYLGRSSLYTLDPLYGLDQPVVASADKEEALIVQFKTIQPDAWFNQELLILSRQPSYFKPLVQE